MNSRSKALQNFGLYVRHAGGTLCLSLSLFLSSKYTRAWIGVNEFGIDATGLLSRGRYSRSSNRNTWLVQIKFVHARSNILNFFFLFFCKEGITAMLITGRFFLSFSPFLSLQIMVLLRAVSILLHFTYTHVDVCSSQ